MPQFHLQSGSRAGEVIELTGEIITIGSAPGNMIELDGADVGPFHATLVGEAGDYVLCDQQTSAGTFVNGVRIDEQKLVSGDQVFIGGVPMLYASEIPRPAEPAPQEFVPTSPAAASPAPAHANRTLLWAGLAGLLAIVAAVAGYALLHRPPGLVEAPPTPGAVTLTSPLPESAKPTPAPVPAPPVPATNPRQTTPVPTPSQTPEPEKLASVPEPPATPVPDVSMPEPPPPVTPTPPPAAVNPIKSATKDNPFINSLSMKFVPAGTPGVLFSVWETRVEDALAFTAATGHVWKQPNFEQGPGHPVVHVSWEEAVAFCAWLSKTERRTYRLPTDAEWSAAAGLGAESGSTPEEKNGRVAGYPWGGRWPPPPRVAGNYSPALQADNFARTAAVGSFAANGFGICDLSGNAWEWCEDRYARNSANRVLRGGGWETTSETYLRSSYRLHAPPLLSYNIYGFRCVLVVSPPASRPPPIPGLDPPEPQGGASGGTSGVPPIPGLDLGRAPVEPAGIPNAGVIAKLQGKWTVIASENEGQASGERVVRALAQSCLIEGQRFLDTIFEGQSKARGNFVDETRSGGTLIVNPLANPMEIDFVYDSGPLAGKVRKGIFRLEGNRLTICRRSEGGARPRVFQTRMGEKDLWMEVLQSDRPAGAPAGEPPGVPARPPADNTPNLPALRAAALRRQVIAQIQNTKWTWEDPPGERKGTIEISADSVRGSFGLEGPWIATGPQTISWQNHVLTFDATFQTFTGYWFNLGQRRAGQRLRIPKIPPAGAGFQP